ncbi:MAG: hypothetical protein PT118_26175, partial [Aphanizomenon gracile PMC644.10]|nr:hypothetical protein [Aphanizomenon gracile PMC644.10]
YPQNSELLAAALRYRTSHHPKSDRIPIIPQQAIPTERFAIAPPHPKKGDSYGVLRYQSL